METLEDPIINEPKIPVLKEDTLSYSLTAKDNPKDKIEVEIGDSKDLTQFQPQVKIMRWDNEVNLSYRLKTDEVANETVTQADEVITWDKGNYQVQTYDLPISEKDPEGGMEFEVILKEKPKTNVIEFSLNTKGLEFWYQPIYTDKEISEALLIGDYKNRDAMGSYVVNCSERKINLQGGKIYKTGQVGIIKRPKILDSEGKEIWGELKIDIEKGILSVIIPQEFLDKAVYPVKHASGLNFGYETIGTSGYATFWSGVVDTSDTTYTGGSGNLTSMSFYGYSDNGNRNAQLGIYDTSSPSNHIDHTGSITVSYNSGSPGWLTGSTVGSAAVSSSQYYLCFNSDNTTVAIAYTTGGSNNFKLKSSVNYGTWPSTITWSSGSYKRIFSVYATYTAGGGDAVQSTGSMSTNTGYWGA